jgi:hypothetical protein
MGNRRAQLSKRNSRKLILVIQNNDMARICGFHGGSYEKCRLLGWGAFFMLKLKLKISLGWGAVKTDILYIGQCAFVSSSRLGLMTRFFFSVWQLWLSWCWASSLTRRWVCNLPVQLLLGLARAVTLGSKSRRTHDHTLLSHLRPPNLEGQVPAFISLRNKAAQLYHRTLSSLSVAS